MYPSATAKTEYSNRSLPLCQYTYRYLWSVKRHQEAQRQLCGNSYNQNFLDFVCVDDIGMLLQPDYVSQQISEAAYKVRSEADKVPRPSAPVCQAHDKK